MEQLCELRRALHRNAEVGFDLTNTRKIIKEFLEKQEVDYLVIGKGSIVARVGGGEYGILLRADMDALQMEEKAPLPYAAINGCMHACGHDMHTAMLLGAVSALASEREKFPFEIRFLFQASEENLMGAYDALCAGVLEPWEKIQGENDEKCKQEFENKREYFIRKAYSLHCLSALPLPVGTLVVGASGISAPASSFFELTLHGANAHGATPHIGKDALRCAVALYQALATLAQSTVSVADAPLLTVGELRSGVAPNVIASTATLRGTVRSMNDESQRLLCEKILEISQKLSDAYSVECEARLLGAAPTLVNDSKLVKETTAALRACLGEERVLSAQELSVEGQRRNGGSEDFAHFSHLVPSLFIGICAGDSREGYTYPLHHPMVAFDEDALSFGVRVLTLLAHFEMGS